MSVSSFPSNSFLCGADVYDVDSNGRIVGEIGSVSERLAYQAISSRCAEVSSDLPLLPEEASASLAIPVLRGDQVVSVVVFSSKRISDGKDDVVGVFEVWEPVGIYEEVALKDGFYGRMERFHNVSTFVRFEKGNGLPGQVWQQQHGVIHDDLSNHPGFLRAAGASAELLRTAIGIPISSNAFHGTAVLISSMVSPLARGFEVWRADEQGFSLATCAYPDLQLECETAGGDVVARLDRNQGLPGLALSREGAVRTDDLDCLLAGRSIKEGSDQPVFGLAIPSFQGESLTSVTALIF